MAQDQTRWTDAPQGYGVVSRAFHWGMAMLFAWHFLGVIVGRLAPKTPIADFFWSTHQTMGFSLLFLVLLRGAWGLFNARRRPPYEASALGRTARLGHLALYALMVVIPSLALLRQYGSGEPFAPFGIPLMSGFEPKIPWMIAPAEAVHGLLGWTLLVLIVGHIAMTLVHRLAWNDEIPSRMTASGASGNS